MTKKILIVDDDLDTLRLVGLLLERKGYQISAADNGVQALEKAHLEHPDLILLDVMMPEMDGIEVLKRLRSNADTSDIPIIMFTAKSHVEDKVTGFEASADDYLTKPTHPAELTARVRNLLSRSTGKKPPAAEPPVSGQKGNVISVIGARGGLGVTTVAANLALALQRASGDAVTVVELVPGTGSLGFMFGVNEPNDLTVLLRKNPAAISETDLRGALIRHESGLNFLPASYLPNDAKYRSSGDQMAAVVECLARMFDHVVVDLGSGITLGSEKVLDKTDSVVVVIDPGPATIAQTRVLLDELRMKVLGLGAIQIALVNRARLEREPTPRELETGLGHSVAAIVPPIPDLAYRAFEKGTPILLLHPDGAFADQFRKLAESVAISRE
ncbi:MAG TPA: response regulator [Anaerolineales bacterium]|nr:response regulator [Anaerolineales bacterium]